MSFCHLKWWLSTHSEVLLHLYHLAVFLYLFILRSYGPLEKVNCSLHGRHQKDACRSLPRICSFTSLCDSANRPLFNSPHYAFSYNCSGNLSWLFGLQPVILIVARRACVFRTWTYLRTPCSFQKIYRYTVRETNAVRKPGQGNYKMHGKPLCTPRWFH